jgi:hypothetical protein
MRATFLRLMLFAFAATSVAAQSINWREYKNPAGNFSVQMPAEPKDTKNGASDEASHTVQAVVAGVGYTVVYSKLSVDEAVDDAHFKEYKEGTLDAAKCTVANEAPATPVIPGFIGRHYRLDCAAGPQKLNFVGNMYVGKHYSYTVMAMFAASPVDSPNVKKFVESFALIDPAK